MALLIIFASKIGKIKSLENCDVKYLVINTHFRNICSILKSREIAWTELNTKIVATVWQVGTPL